MGYSRIEKSIKNMGTGLIVYIATIILQFINRIFFLRYLSIDYLGINGLFSNILSMLNIAELGIAGAMVYALYKPLTEKNTEEIKSIMFLYKKLYQIVGSIVFLLGFILTSFLNFFINVNEVGEIRHLKVYFLIYVIDAGISYFLSYKRSIIICNQEYYLINGTNFLKVLLTNLFQIVILVLTRNYFIYLLVKVIFTFGENVLIGIIANKQYPFLKEKAKLPNKEFMINIKKNILAMSMHKIGTIVVFGTDNIIISKLVSLTATGLYSNYTMIGNAAASILSQFFTAITASVGNLIIEKKDYDREYIYNMFKNIYFINFCLYYVFSIGIYICLEDFISIWIGKSYLLPKGILLYFVLNFFSLGMRKTVLVFKDADGLFWKDRYKPIAEALSNIIFSIPLTILWGIAGTLIGTILTNIFIAGLIEAYVTYKYLFNKNVSKYLLLQAKYYLILLISLIPINYMCSQISLNIVFSLLLKIILVIFASVVLVVTFFSKTEEFKYTMRLAISLIKSRVGGKNNV